MKTHYKRAANVAASTIAISLALVSCGGPKGPNPPVKAAKPAPEFVAEVNKELVDIAREFPACLGARLTGGGFGGATINLVWADQTQPFITAISKSYEAKTGRKLQPMVCKIVDGAE